MIALVAAFAGCADPQSRERDTVDLMVFAPHPDDETLGCAGILHQALQRGERAKVVLFTSGDGFPALAALVARKSVDRLSEEDFRDLGRFRQAESRSAFKVLGGKSEDLIFLGYPDAALDQIYRNRGTAPVRQRFTGKSETYGEDYRSAIRGTPAPYLHQEVLADVTSLLVAHRPRRVCVTAEADQHPDHQAAFRFVRDAVEKTEFRGDLDTYLIHGGPEWPWPMGATPRGPYEAHEVTGTPIPKGVPWPPPRRVALTPEEAAVKARSIAEQASHLSGDDPASRAKRLYFDSFVKSEEVFWRADQARR